MAFQPQVYTIPSMVSGNSITSSLSLNGSYISMYLQVPTMTGGFGADTQIFVQGSADGTTFYRYSLPQTNTSTVAANDFVIASSTTQRIVLVPGFALPYIRIETTAVATAGVSSNTPFKLICVSNQ